MISLQFIRSGFRFVNKHTTVRKRKDLGRVGEGHRTLTGRVERGEQEDEESNGGQVGSAWRDVKAECRGKQSPSHLWKGEEQQSSTAPSVDGPDGGEGEEEIDQTEPPGGKQSALIRSSRLHEDGARVEGNNVDYANLLEIVPSIGLGMAGEWKG